MAKRARSAGQSCRTPPLAQGAGRQQLLEALLTERLHSLQHAPAAYTAAPDPIDAAQEREEEIVRLAVLDLGRDIQAQVGEALHRLAAGRYGLCADCGGRIHLARLRALPFAIRCLSCQERRERQARGLVAGAAARAAPEDGFGLGRRNDRPPRMVSGCRRPAA